MNQPIRVLHVFGCMNRGGAETFIMNVYRRIDRQRIQFDFAVHCPLPGHYDDEIRSLGGRIFVLPRPNPKRLPGYVKALAQVLHHEGPFAAVHSHVHFFSGVPLAVAAAAGVPRRIAHSHNSFDGRKGTLPRLAYRWLMRRMINRYATYMLGCSHLACEALYGTSCWRDTRVKVLHYGIDLEPFRRLPENRLVLRKKIGFPEDAVLIGHVGRFDVQKNHHFLVRVFEALLNQLPLARLVLVGDGPLRSEIEKQVASKGIQDRVFFLGIRADIPEIMGCLDVFVFPSLWEGFGIVLLEAQAAGVPCIVSDIVPEEVDVGLGLLQRVSLNSDISIWVQGIISSLERFVPKFTERANALKKHGYSIDAPAMTLQEIYL